MISATVEPKSSKKSRLLYKRDLIPSIIEELFEVANKETVLEDFYSQVTKVFVEKLHFERSCLWLFDTEKKILNAISIYFQKGVIKSVSDDTIDFTRFTIKPGKNIIGHVFSSKQSMLVRNTDLNEQDKKLLRLFKEDEPLSILYLPLSAKTCGLGVLIVTMSDSHIFTDRIRKDLQIITGIIAHILFSTIIRNKMALNIHELTKQNIILKDANRVKSDFLAQMRQQMRTPMNGIMGITQLLFKTKVNLQQKKYLDVLKLSADRLFTTIEEILEYSNLSDGNFELVESFFSLKEIINKIYQSYKYKAAEKGIDVWCEIADDIPEIIFTDPKRLHQILMLLFGNSLKYTNEGLISLQVSLLESQQNKNQKIPSPVNKLKENAEINKEKGILFSLSDSAMSIDPAKLEQIFLPFTEVYESSSLDTNTGLALAKELAEKMNGMIWVENKENSGNRFNFIIFTRYSSLD